MAQAYSLCLLINVYYPYLCLVKFFPCEQGTHLFFLHQGPVTSLAATGTDAGLSLCSVTTVVITEALVLWSH